MCTLLSCQAGWVSSLQIPTGVCKYSSEVWHEGYATLTISVGGGAGQKPVKGEATLKRGENREGVRIVLSRIPQPQLQRCCRGQKRF